MCLNLVLALVVSNARAFSRLWPDTDIGSSCVLVLASFASSELYGVSERLDVYYDCFPTSKPFFFFHSWGLSSVRFLNSLAGIPRSLRITVLVFVRVTISYVSMQYVYSLHEH